MEQLESWAYLRHRQRRAEWIEGFLIGAGWTAIPVLIVGMALGILRITGCS